MSDQNELTAWGAVSHFLGAAIGMLVRMGKTDEQIYEFVGDSIAVARSVLKNSTTVQKVFQVIEKEGLDAIAKKRENRS